MARSILLDPTPVTIPNGTRQYARAIDQPGRLLISIGRQTTATPTLWPASVGVEIVVEVSSDNGGTWQELVRATSAGGIAIGRDGLELPATRITVSFPPEANMTRLTVTVTNGPLPTVVSIERI